MGSTITTFGILWCILVLACVAVGGETDPGPAPRAATAVEGPPTPTDPVDGLVTLPAAADWEASLIIDNGDTGIWTVDSFQVFPQFGCPEVVGLDDKGRCLVMVGYSGRWKPYPIIHDHKWLGGLAHGDVDPRIPGRELYTGGQRGNLFQVVGYKDGALDCRRIAHLPGREIHTIVAGDFDPRNDGAELIVFTRPGGLYRMTPTGPDGTFETTKLAELEGRVRDAVVLPDRRIATVSRDGRLRLLEITAEGPRWDTVYEASMGMGRIAGRDGLLYTTHDDGRVLRHERTGGRWRTETIYRGPLGPRGVAAGRFDPDPDVETVAVFGYSGKVELLTRADGRWTAKTLFVDRNKGHWLVAAELDGRNDTRELLLSGYGARIVMLARPPAHGAKDSPPATVKNE